MGERKPIAMFAGEYAFLSNFWPEGDDGLSVEHRFQAERVTKEADKHAILTAATSTDARRIARRRVTMPIREDWDDIQVDVMRQLLEQKFAEPNLRRLLLATEDAELIAGDPWGDQFWGVDPRTGEGRNELGKQLMALRARLQ